MLLRPEAVVHFLFSLHESSGDTSLHYNVIALVNRGLQCCIVICIRSVQRRVGLLRLSRQLWRPHECSPRLRHFVRLHHSFRYASMSSWSVSFVSLMVSLLSDLRGSFFRSTRFISSNCSYTSFNLLRRLSLSALFFLRSLLLFCCPLLLLTFLFRGELLFPPLPILQQQAAYWLSQSLLPRTSSSAGNSFQT